MRYLAIVDQGGGCDYTIGCGVKNFIFEADGTIQAIEKLHELIEDYIYSDDYNIESVKMFELSTEIVVPLNGWRQERRRQEQQAESQKQLDKELREYARLKQKFSN